MVEQKFTVAFRGLGLAGVACSARAGEGGDAGQAYALFLHGGGLATSSEGTRYLRSDLAANGFASVAFDFTGHGSSEGRLANSSLAHRMAQGLCVVGSLQPSWPRAIVATSMAGHIACRMLDAVRPDALVLFCPAAYEARAETARFGPAFQSVIRSAQALDASPAWAALSRFEGRLVVLYGADDGVIPEVVQSSYASAARRASSVNVMRLAGAGHRLHDWISARPQLRRDVLMRLLGAMH